MYRKNTCNAGYVSKQSRGSAQPWSPQDAGFYSDQAIVDLLRELETCASEGRLSSAFSPLKSSSCGVQRLYLQK